MAYTGNVPATQYTSTVKDTFNGDGTTTDFTLSRPSLVNNLEVFVENVQQEPTTAYTVSGTTLSFTSAPVSGTGNIYVIHRGQAVQTIVPPAGISLNATDATITGAATVGDGLTVDNDGATVATFDRATSDGDIVEFQKGGLSLGSIGNTNGSAPGDLYICSNTASHCGISFSGNRYVPTDNTGSYLDNAVDIGESSTRFKDLYLSGGVYLGGTGTANKLDDYEEGTHDVTLTPATSGSITLQASYNSVSYTKIGRLVYINGNIRISSVSSPNGSVQISLPFTVLNSTQELSRFGGVISVYDSSASVKWRQQPYQGTENASSFVTYNANNDASASSSTFTFAANDEIVFSFVYPTSQ